MKIGEEKMPTTMSGVQILMKHMNDIRTYKENRQECSTKRDNF